MRILAVLAVAAMLVISVQPAQAQDLSFYGGLGFAKVLNDGGPDGSLGITAGVMYPLSGAEGLSIGGETGYLMLGKIEETVCFFGDCYGFESTWSMIPITGQVWYEVPTAGSVTPMLTGGLGLYMLRWNVEVDAGDLSDSDSDSETDLGINFGGGLKFGDPDAGIKFGADARFHLIMTEEESTKLLTVMARVFF